MAEYIKKEAIASKAVYMHGFGKNKYVPLRAIEEAPAADVAPVVHGRWENHPHAYGFLRCSVCHDCNIWGEWADGKKWSFCPHCGARMDGE